MRNFLLLISLVFASLPLFAATIYQWKDERGIVHFSSSPPPNHQSARIIDAKPANGPYDIQQAREYVRGLLNFSEEVNSTRIEQNNQFGLLPNNQSGERY